MFLRSYYGTFCRLLWRTLYFCGNDGPLPNVIFSALYFTHFLLNWRLKFMEMTKCLQNCRFYRTINSNHFSEVKWKLIEKLQISKHFSAHDLRWENDIFWGCAAWSIIPLLTITLIIYLKMVSIYSNMLCSLRIWCLSVQNFIDVS